MIAKEKLKVSESRHNNETNVHKINLEEMIKVLNSLKSKRNYLMEKINEINIKMQEEIVLNYNYNFEKQLKDMKSQIALVNDKYKPMNAKYKEMLIENQSLKDECVIMKTYLDKYSKMPVVHLNEIEKQTEVFSNLKKKTEEINELLKMNNCTIEERNRNLEKANAVLMDNINSINSKKKEFDKTFKDMYSTNDNLLKMKTHKLFDVVEELELIKKENYDVQSIIIDLKEKVATNVKTVLNLKEEVNANDMTISSLQSMIKTLKKDVIEKDQKLQDSAKEYATEESKLVKEITELKNIKRDDVQRIKKLTFECKKFNSKANRMSKKIRRVREHLSRSKPNEINTPNEKIFNLINDDEKTIIIDDDDVSILESNDQNVSNINIGLQSISKTVNYSSECTSPLDISPSIHISNIQMKKQNF